MTIVDQIKNRLNIIDVLGEYIQLKSAGANYKALCPFHQEKTPSLMVSQEKQIWHCFGCSLGGDVFEFVKQIEGVDFPEALRILAKKVGIELKHQNPAEKRWWQKQQSQKSRLYEIMELAAQFWHLTLIKSPKAERARTYLATRAISDLTQDEFKLGWSVDEWRALCDFLLKRGFTAPEIISSGLAVKKIAGSQNVNYYDRFRGRLMFPITDANSQIVGFGGRILEEQQDTAKYVNTPQTEIYNKSQILYGLDKAKTEIRKQNLAIIVEGYFDAISSHQAGVKNVIAVSGTALTLEQIKLLKRWTKNIALAFDFDQAGIGAAVRSMEIASSLGMNIKAIKIPQGKDPDECIRDNPQSWQTAIKDAQSFIDYYFDIVCCGLNFSKLEDKKTASSKLLAVISKIYDPIGQAHYLQKLSRLIKVREEDLRQAMNKLQNPNSKIQTKSKFFVKHSKF